MGVEQQPESVHLSVTNIGGIDNTELAFEPGVTILAGRNTTNRTSLLQAIMAALGSDNATIKADADEAHVELSMGETRCTRRLERRSGTISSSGDPYLADSTVADLFAFLLESNEARRAVAAHDDLRDIIMRPIDTNEIQAEIDHLVQERREVEAELEELDGLKDRLPSLEAQRTQLVSEIEDTESDLQAVEERLAETESNVDESRENQTELEAQLDDLRDKRSTLEDVRYDLQTEQESLESLQAERVEVAAEYDALPETPAGKLDEFDGEIQQLRTRKQHLESELNDIQSVIGFNEEMLDEANDDLLERLESSDDDGTVTDDLLPDETVICWTCGSGVAADQIESTVDTLRDLNRETISEIRAIEDELQELDDQRDELETQQQQRDRLDRRRRELDEEIERTEAQIADLSDRRDTLRDEIEAIEATVETLEDDAYDKVLDLHKEANQLEYDLGSLETDLERIEDNIATIEDRLDEAADLEGRREELTSEIESLRTRIERTEQQAIEEFNTHMETVLERLGYTNLERIWLERTETRVREGRQKVTKSVFELHVVRRTDSGTTYEDTVEHLSESEREVTGLIFALAGYLAHDVYETLPFMLLDSLEAIDSERIATLVDYLRDYSEYLVVALLPEDAQSLDDDFRRIRGI
jgi:DNA repair exonuclease SbcCD ATPase subunit